MNDKTIQAIPDNKCTGCGACLNICQKNAITMREDADGFLHPTIDGTCVDCGLCLSHCPVEKPDFSNDKEPVCFAVMASDSVREQSSSGGVFTLLADWILQRDGVVCGAAYTENYHNVEHIIIEKESDLGALRGSKYVQSATGDVFRRLKQYLTDGRSALFTGTPCQVAGLKAYLGKDYPNLFLADLVCHGTPPVKLFRQFVEELESSHNSEIEYFSFRDKQSYGWSPSTTVRFKSGEILREKRNDSAYLNAFLKLLSLRECCGTCPFATLPRQGDLTLGDFWDIHRFDQALDDKKGTSAVLVNNNKGKALLDSISGDTKLLTEAPLSHAIRYNAQIQYSSKHHKDRYRFFELIRDYRFSVEKAASYALHRHFDIGYIGWWYGLNYGSAITNFALNRVLHNLGKTVLMVDFPFLEGQSSQKGDSASRRFGKNYYETSMRRQVDKHNDLNYYCDSFLVGSDQLWNWWSNRDIGSYHYFLDFADEGHKKIAYATSFGHASGYYPDDMRIKVSYLLHRFDAISVREASGVDICRNIFGVEATQTLDPVFLCPLAEYEKAVGLSSLKKKEEFLLAYILNPTDEKLKAVRYAAAEKNLPYYIIIDGQGNRDELLAMVNDSRTLYDLEIADWLFYFYNSSYIVTDSYHGFCFSILFRKPMIVFPNKLRGVTRFESLGEITGLSYRFVYSFQEILDKRLIQRDIDFTEVNTHLEAEKERSLGWLKASLEAEHRTESAETLSLGKIVEYEETVSTLKKQMDRLTSRMNHFEPIFEFAKKMRGKGSRK